MKLRALRTTKGVTQIQLSQASGIDQSTISRMETGKQDVSVSQLRKLAIALGVKPADLLADEEPMDHAA